MSLAKQWASKKGVKDLTLPSGTVIKVKENRLFALTMANILPLPLLEKAVGGEMPDKNSSSDLQQMVAGVKKLVPLIQAIVVEPKIVMELSPGQVLADDEILFTDIPDDDVSAIIRYVMGASEVASVESFRDGSPGDSLGQVGAEVSPAPVSDSKD